MVCKMFTFRVKHLVGISILSVVYLCFSSYQAPENIVSAIASASEQDAIERFIDRYISEEPDDNLVLENTATTEEEVAYLYFEHYEDDNEENSDYDRSDYSYEEDGDADDGYDDQGDYESKIDAALHRSQPRYVLDDSPNLGLNIKKSANKQAKRHYSPENERKPIIFHPKNVSMHSFDSTVKKVTAGTKANERLSLERTDESKSNPDNSTILLTINKAFQDAMKKDSPLVILPRDSYWPPVLEPSDAKFFSDIDYTKYDPEDRAYLLGRVGVYEERARAVGEVCRNNPHLISPTPIHTFVWDQLHDPNIVWCEISKVASTSWMVNFLRLGHYKENDTSLSHLTEEDRDAIRFDTQLEDDNLHFKVFRLFPAPNTNVERNQIFSNALRFIIVRHPLARLLSAYMDKMTVLDPIPKIYNFRKLQLDIIKRYRGNANIPYADPQFPTFGEFIQHVIDSTANHKTLNDWRKVVCWQPYWAKCGVCAHDFQMIMKLETMVDDEHFLVTLAGLRELDKVFEWRHSRQTVISKEEYFKQLSTKQMELIHERYLLDFQLFGYSMHQYLELAYDAP